MRLTIYNHVREFTPVRSFREKFDLPPEFGITQFFAKDFTGLGSLDQAGDALEVLRHAILNAIPEETPPEGWLAFALRLQLTFNRNLERINPRIGLLPSEIEFAAMGFGELCQVFIYAVLRARIEQKPLPPVQDLYRDWLNNTTAVSLVTYLYPYRGDTWRIQMVRTAYGRVGLIIQTAESTYYVQDAQLGCPAEGFIASLIEEVATKIAAVLGVRLGAVEPTATAHSRYVHALISQ